MTPEPGAPPVPRVLPYGDRALLVELGGTPAVLAYVDALRARPVPGVADVVPAAETVLVVLEEDAAAVRVRDRLAQLEGQESPEDRGPSEGAEASKGAEAVERAGRGAAGPEEAGEQPIEIPVRYDGPDLADVARLTGLSEAEVVTAHTGSTWRVAFGGFAPGFGYLVGGDPRLEVPRRDSARTAVPAGAVGLAGSYSGVYPRESPGGWQLIGTTEAAMWDLERDEPALLRVGAAVRFVDVDAGGDAPGEGR
jgi:KipI family sensor histidine kinase inhibitor